MDRFWIIFLSLAVVVPLTAATYFYFFYPGEYDDGPMDESGFVWMPNRVDSGSVNETSFSRAKAKADKVQQQFLAADYANVEFEIESARNRGYTPWYLGSWQAFYFKYLREDPEATNPEDIERAMQWTKNSPDNTYAFAFLGDLYTNLGWEARGGEFAHETPKESFKKMYEFFNLAIVAYNKALEIDPANVYASRELLSMSRTGRLKIDKNRVFEEAIKHRPDYYYLYQSYLTDLDPRWGGSVDQMFEFARRYSGDDSAYPALSRLISKAHEYRANQLALKRSRLDPPVGQADVDWKVYWKEYYKYFRDDEVWDEYSHAFETVFTAFPGYADGLHRYAIVAEGSGRKQTALKYFEKSMQADAVLLGADKVFRFAGVLRAANYNAQANKYYRMYLDLSPDYIDAKNAHAAADFVGWQYSTEGKYKESFPYYKIVAELTPDSARSLSNYCNALYNIYEYEEGIKYCNQAIEIDPEHSWSYYILAEIYKRTGDSEQSLHYQNLYSGMTKQ